MNYRLSININFLKSCSFSKNRNEKILRIAILLVNNIVKHVKGYQISTDFNSCKVYVKDFPGANFQCKQDYVLNLLYKNRGHIHAGTKDLASKCSTEEIANSIVKLSKSSKSYKRKKVTKCFIFLA